MTEDEKYDIAVKLIGNGYLIHCTNAVFNEFDKAYIKGGSRAHEGYGFYFTDLPYKAISYGEIFKIIRKDDFNFLNTLDFGGYPISTFDYDKGVFTGSWHATWHPFVVCQLMHAHLGKPDRVCIFRAIQIMDESDVRAYQRPLDKSEHIRLEKEVENNGLDATIDKYLSYCDCTIWDSQHKYRLCQTIDYVYIMDMSRLLYIVDTFANDNDHMAKVIKRHEDNIKFEAEVPPIIYDKRLNRKSLKKSIDKATRSNADNKHKTSKRTKAEEKLAIKAARIGQLKFKI